MNKFILKIFTLLCNLFGGGGDLALEVENLLYPKNNYWEVVLFLLYGIIISVPYIILVMLSLIIILLYSIIQKLICDFIDLFV